MLSQLRDTTAPPLRAGNLTSSQDERRILYQLAAQEGAKLALEEFRKERKLGRDDRGTGSESIGKALRSTREMHGLTQQELADRVKIHYTTIGKIETGDRGMSLTTFAKLASVLGSVFVDQVITELSGK
jgi:DNA-binding XRE family transcriptional regulator